MSGEPGLDDMFVPNCFVVCVLQQLQPHVPQVACLLHPVTRYCSCQLLLLSNCRDGCFVLIPTMDLVFYALGSGEYDEMAREWTGLCCSAAAVAAGPACSVAQGHEAALLYKLQQPAIRNMYCGSCFA